MDALDEAWAAYFAELDPDRRLERFNRLAEGEDSGFQAFARQIYAARYSDPRQPDRKVDTWLWKLVYLPGVYKKRRMLAGALRREMAGTLHDLYLDRPEELTGERETILYHEYRNAARRYLSTCSGARYGSRLFGLKKATPREQREKACEDVWQASRGVALAAGMERAFGLWCAALHDALLEYDPDCGAQYEKLEQSFQIQK